MSFHNSRSTAPRLTMVALLFVIFIAAPHTGLALAQWSTPVRISEPGGYAYPQIIASGDTLHVVYEDARGTGDIGYQRSTDAGETWSQEIVLSDDSCTTVFPRIIGSGRRLMALWRTVFDYGPYRDNNIGYSTTTNGGQTWTLPRYIFDPNWWGIMYFAASASDSEINVVVASQESSLVFYCARSSSWGQSWSDTLRLFSANFSGGLPDQAAGLDNVYFLWAGGFDQQAVGDVFCIRSTNRGLDWSNNIPISTIDAYPSQRPAVSITADDNAAVTWWDFKYSPYWLTGDILIRESVDSGCSWGLEYQATYNHFAAGSNDVAMSSDTINIAWEDASADLGHRSIYYTRSTDNGLTWGDPYWLDQTLDDSWDPALAVSNGRVYAVWADARYEPDSSRGGLYLSRWAPEPDAAEEENGVVKPDMTYLAAYPNPFNSSTFISYTGALAASELGIYDIQGQLVKSIKFEGKEGRVAWDGTDDAGKAVASGIYFARVHYGSKATEVSKSSDTIKLIYLK